MPQREYRILNRVQINLKSGTLLNAKQDSVSFPLLHTSGGGAQAREENRVTLVWGDEWSSILFPLEGRLAHVLSVAIAPRMGVLPVIPLLHPVEGILIFLFFLLLQLWLFFLLRHSVGLRW